MAELDNKNWIGETPVSTGVLILGLVLFVAGLRESPKVLSDGLVVGWGPEQGLVIVCFALAFQSARKRKRGAVKSLMLQVTFELVLVVVGLALAFGKNRLKERLALDPGEFVNAVVGLLIYLIRVVWPGGPLRLKQTQGT